MRKAVLLAILTVLAARAAEVDERRIIRQSFPLAAGGKVTVDNVLGSIKVTGAEGREVRAVIQERLRADSPEKAAEARRKVKLDMSPAAGGVRFYVDGPFRCQDGCVHQQGDRGYSVRYDFELQAPATAVVDLKNVTGGAITLENTTGDFAVRNVNGAVELREISGSGDARTVNGAVRATFRRNPRGPCAFHTINGELSGTFPPDLSADLRFKTFHGDVYTDFPVTYLPRVETVAGRKAGRFVYRANRSFSVRVGSGGPEIFFDGFNGVINVLKRGQ